MPFLFAAERAGASKPFKLAHSPFVVDVSRVQRGLGFDKNNMNFLVRHGHVLDAAGNDDELPFADNRLVVAETHAQSALHDEKKLVLVIMMMPDKLALQFHGLYGAIVDFANHAGIAIV